MAQPPAFQLYAADFYMDTVSWPIDAVGIYTRFLFYQWVNGFLPNDDKELSRIAGCSVKKLLNNSIYWSTKFIKKDDNKLINERLEKTRNKQLEYREKQVKSGSKGGLKKQENLHKEPSKPSSEPISKPSSENVALRSSSSTSSPNNLISLTDVVSKGDDLKPVDNSPELEDEKTAFLKNLKTAIDGTLERHNSVTDQMEIANWIKAHIRTGNPKAIIHAVNSLILSPEKVLKITSYMDAVFRIEDGKYNASDHEEFSRQFKEPIDFGDLGKLLKMSIKSMPATA